jgi:hypothetical protein
MIKPLTIYAAVTILLALVDHIRRDKEMGKKKNISHKVSTWIAILSFAPLWLIFYVSLPWLWFFLYGLILGVGCIGVRLFLYDPALNLMIDGKLSNISTTTNSYKDNHTNHVSFWRMRGIGAGMIFIAWLINYLLK